MRTSYVALAVLAILLCSAPAHGEPPLRKPVAPAALEHYALGAKLYNVQSFLEAANQYKASALIEPAPATDYNLGQCYRMLGETGEDPKLRKEHYEKAIWHYERFIKASPDTPERNAVVGGWIDELRTKLATLPQSAERSTSAAPPAIPPERSHWYGDGIAWALTGSGVATLGVAGGLFLSASNLHDEANRTPSQQEQNSLRNKADTRSLVGTTLGIVGGGLAVVGIVKLAIHSDPRDVGRHAWNLSVSPNGIVVFGWF
ncbi:MAG: tetratricopeptide repeat protein [Kofleriaceae bacterium]